jgi:hypothetical protein
VGVYYAHVSMYLGNTHHSSREPPARTRPGAESNQRWYEAALQHCVDRGFHSTNARDWLDFNDGRRSLSMRHYTFDQSSLTLDLRLGSGGDVRGVTLALPYTFRGSVMKTAEVDDEPVEIEPQQLEGRQQVLLPADYTAGESRRWRVRWGVG